MNNAIYIVCVLVVIGCRENVQTKQSSQEIKVSNNCNLSPDADSLLREYVKHTPNAKAYAIYFDKKDEDEYKLTVAPFDKRDNDVNNVQALNYFLLNDSTPVFLYSGIEDFIVNDTVKLASETYKPDLAHSWSLVKTKDTSYIVEGDTYPFINLTLKPTIYFQPPHGR